MPLTEHEQRRLRNAVLSLYETYGARSNHAPNVTEFNFPAESGHGDFWVQKRGQEHPTRIQYYAEGRVVTCCNHATNWDDPWYDQTRWEKAAQAK